MSNRNVRRFSAQCTAPNEICRLICKNLITKFNAKNCIALCLVIAENYTFHRIQKENVLSFLYKKVHGFYLKTILKAGSYFILLIFYWLIFKYFDPIGFEGATKSASSQFFSAIAEPFYGYGETRRSQRHVAVVEISDDTLKQKKETWPVSYHREAYWLRNIIDAHPAAVLVDIYFDGERQGDSLHAFDAVLAEAKEMGIPIFFVRGAAAELAHDLPAPLEPYQVYSGWQQEKEGMYPLWVSSPKDDGKLFPTAAFAMYSALCNGAWSNLCKAGEGFEEPLFVRWGVYQDPEQKIAFDGDSGTCLNSQAGGLARLWRAMGTGLHALSGKWEPPRKNRCFYPLTMDADQLDLLSPITHKPYTDMLRGRAVFFGGDLQAIHDVTYAPAIGQLPAVQLHAMAFDNLMTYGEHYFHESEGWLKFSIFGHEMELDRAEGLELGIWAALSLTLSISFVLKHRKERKASEENSSSKKTNILKLAVAGALSIAGLIIDLSERGIFSFTIVIFYIMLFLSIFIMSVQFETRTYFVKLKQTLCVCSIVFCVNELFLHWPNADWIGLALLWFTVPEVTEDNSFVNSVAELIKKISPFKTNPKHKIHSHG